MSAVRWPAPLATQCAFAAGAEEVLDPLSRSVWRRSPQYKRLPRCWPRAEVGQQLTTVFDVSPKLAKACRCGPNLGRCWANVGKNLAEYNQRSPNSVIGHDLPICAKVVPKVATMRPNSVKMGRQWPICCRCWGPDRSNLGQIPRASAMSLPKSASICIFRAISEFAAISDGTFWDAWRLIVLMLPPTCV